MSGTFDVSGITTHHRGFLLFGILSLVLFWSPLAVLANLVAHDERYSYIAVVPFVSLCLIYLARKRIFRDPRPALRAGISPLAGGLVLYAAIRVAGPRFSPAIALSLAAAALVLVWIGAFVICYGVKPWKAAIFPLLFLALIIPPPPVVLRDAVTWLQRGSAEMSYILFKLFGVPVLRQGFTFSLPGLDIEIAQQCSGLRSSLSLFLTSVLAGHLVLHSAWKKVCFSLFSIPIVIFKNALRIVVLSVLGAYVDRDILFGTLHRSSGLLFSPLALGALGYLLLLLYRSEENVKRVANSNGD